MHEHMLCLQRHLQLLKKNMNYLGIHLTRHGQDLYAGNHKMMKKVRVRKYLGVSDHEDST